jgi:hypothetical protein
MISNSYARKNLVIVEKYPAEASSKRGACIYYKYEMACEF